MPRSIALAEGDRSDGWLASYLQETLAPAIDKESSILGTIAPSRRVEDFDWAVRGGEITGRKLESTLSVRKVVQSQLTYARPLGEGETLRYRFYYEPGQVAVHPALDRLAFLMEPEGVRLHWIVPAMEADSSDVEPSNVVDVPGERRGPTPLPLKAKDWNAVKLALADGRVSITLNDVLVYERPLDPGNNRGFSFYHEKDRTQARIREVVLEGNWPQEAPDNLFARRGEDGPPAIRQARHAVVGEAMLALSAEQVFLRSRQLPRAERYEALAAWVLPGDDHSTFRLQGDFAPTDPAPSVGLGTRRGGSLVAPALDLVALAKELGRLPELEKRVRGFEAKTDLDRRGQLALEALILAAQGQDDQAVETLGKLPPLLAKVAADAPDWMRWPELVAVDGLPESLRYGKAAVALLDGLAAVSPKKEASLPGWLRHARQERAWVQLHNAGGSTQLAGWLTVSPGRAETRGAGDPLPFWTFREGVWSRSPGERGDSLVFATPLHAPFVLDTELRSTSEGQTDLTYGGLRLGVNPEGTHLNRSLGGASLADVKLPPAVKNSDGWRSLRLEARESSLIVSVDGAKVTEQTLVGASDPWLAMDTHEGGLASVRNLKISGTPRIPETIELGDSTNLSGWSSAYYGEATAGLNVAWEKRGDEVAGVQLKPPPANSNNSRSSDTSELATYAFPGSRCESLLRYRRPLREDGSLEYEFFYAPGKTMVYPALGRLAFLLAPKGVSLHWLTDAQYERTGLAPDNETTESANRRGSGDLPLKAGDWNRLKLALSGDKVSLVLNDMLIYERTLEPENSRLFGFFHFAEETNCRIRKVILRGQWPRSLPESTKPHAMLPARSLRPIDLMAASPSAR